MKLFIANVDLLSVTGCSTIIAISSSRSSQSSKYIIYSVYTIYL